MEIWRRRGFGIAGRWLPSTRASIAKRFGDSWLCRVADTGFQVGGWEGGMGRMEVGEDLVNGKCVDGGKLCRFAMRGDGIA